jgi:putative Mg2+ transporter-C (MgtC) family protein
MESMDWVMVGRLALAAFLGGLIGLERETHSQPAGLRTHMMVSLGSALIMTLSLFMSKLDPSRADPGRLAAQVVAGIGFLGAGAIMRFGMSVKGLTTAASLWTCAAIGLAAGCGHWQAAGVTTAFTLIILFLFDKFERSFLMNRAYRKFVIHARDASGIVGRVEGVMERAGIAIRELDIQRDVVDRKVQIAITAVCPGNADVDALSRSIGAFPEVEKVEIE